MKIAIVAGEDSGDSIAANIIQGLRCKYPQAEFMGLTGPKMRAQGCKSIADFADINVMGFLPVVKKIITIFKIRNKLLKAFRQVQPDLFIGVDYTDFNIRLAGHMKKIGVKTLQYKGPSVWAWRAGRKKLVEKNIDVLFTIFPFESTAYKNTKIKTIYVGHPLLYNIPVKINNKLNKNSLNISETHLLLALLPGSRAQEIASLSRIYLEAVVVLTKMIPGLCVVCAHANFERMRQFKNILGQMNVESKVNILHEVNNTGTVLAASDAVLVTSGTATFETMLYKKPMVVVYKVSYILGKVLKKMIKAPYIALPNLLFNSQIVRELKQEEANVDNIVQELSALLLKKEIREEIAEKFTEMHIKLQNDASTDMVESVQSMIEND